MLWAERPGDTALCVNRDQTFYAEVEVHQSQTRPKYQIGSADIARAGELVAGAVPIPSQAASVAFSAGLGALCYGLAPKVMDNVNTVLVGGVVVTFLVNTFSAHGSCVLVLCIPRRQSSSDPGNKQVKNRTMTLIPRRGMGRLGSQASCRHATDAPSLHRELLRSQFSSYDIMLTAAEYASMQGLLSTAAPGVDTQALLKADLSAVPKTLPVLSLAFVFHNIIPVISTDLEVALVIGPTFLCVLLSRACTSGVSAQLPACKFPMVPVSYAAVSRDSVADKLAKSPGRSPAGKTPWLPRHD